MVNTNVFEKSKYIKASLTRCWKFLCRQNYRRFFSYSTKLLVITGIYILFHKKIELFLICIFVQKGWLGVESNIVNDGVIYVFTVLAALWIIYYRSNKYIISAHRQLIILPLLIIIGYYRFCSNYVWTFAALSSCNDVKYVDSIFVVSALFILSFFLPYIGYGVLYIWGALVKHSTVQSTEYGFFIDQAVEESCDDSLQYTHYAEKIAAKIMASVEIPDRKLTPINKNALAIGVTGEWGTGKTSFTNLLKKSLYNKQYKHKVIVMEFNPWQSSTSQAILQDFFDTLQESLVHYHSGISRKLLKYAQKLGESVIAIKSIGAIFGVAHDESIARQYKSINRTLNKIGKKVVVIIDDLDRLDKNEVVEVLRIMRNAASFSNMVFIATYDRAYLIAAIKSVVDYNSEYFLEKIFQLEIHLPYYPLYYLEERMLLLLTRGRREDNADSQIYYSQIKNLTSGEYRRANYKLDWTIYLTTLRDITRFANGFLFHYEQLQKDIEVNDLFYLEMLRLKYPKAYELLFKKTIDILGFAPQSNYAVKQRPQLILLPSSTNENELKLEEKLKELSVSQNDIQQILILIQHLFPTDREQVETELSIRYAENFHRYFAYRLLEEDVSEAEFTYARYTSAMVFLQRLQEWLTNEKKWLALRDRFYRLEDFKSRDDFELIIRGIFLFIRTTSARNLDVSLYGDYNVIKKLFVRSNNTNLYQGKNEEFCFFVRNMLRGECRQITDASIEPLAYLTEGKIICRLIEYLLHIEEDKQYSHLIALSREYAEIQIIETIKIAQFASYVSIVSLQKLAIRNLKKFLNREQRWNGSTYTLMWLCITGSSYEDRNKSKITQALTGQEITRILSIKIRRPIWSFLVKKDLDTFLLFLLYPSSDGRGAYHIRQEAVGALWDSWLDFEKFLAGQSPNRWEYLEEFLKIYEKFKMNDYKSVTHDFDTKIPLKMIAFRWASYPFS